MIKILNKYLVQHKSINVPGLGTIFAEHQPAIFDAVNKRILPPHHEFRFNKYFDTPDTDFFSFLSLETGVPDHEAINLYNKFAQDLCNDIKQDDKAEWPGVGIFTRNSAGDMIFESVKDSQELYAPVSAIKIVRDKTAHTTLAVDRQITDPGNNDVLNQEELQQPTAKKITWWMYALVLFIIALVIIIIHFYENGFSLADAANQQQL